MVLPRALYLFGNISHLGPGQVFLIRTISLPKFIVIAPAWAIIFGFPSNSVRFLVDMRSIFTVLFVYSDQSCPEVSAKSERIAYLV